MWGFDIDIDTDLSLLGYHVLVNGKQLWTALEILETSNTF